MTVTKFASLTVNSRLQPVLVIDPGSHLAIGKIIQGLKQMRTGLWPRHEGDTCIVITATAGKEAELYKLAWSLPGRGYKLEETAQHKGLDEALAQRKAEIEARVAQAAIPPHSFASKRFSFRWHPRGIQVSFLSQGDFTRWTQGHGISYTNLSRHRAIISKQDFFALDMPMKALKGKASRFLPGYGPAQCPWVQPPVPSAAADPEPTSEPSPTASWTKDRIKSWLSSRGVDIIGITRKADLLELVQEVH